MSLRNHYAKLSHQISAKIYFMYVNLDLFVKNNMHNNKIYITVFLNTLKY